MATRKIINKSRNGCLTCRRRHVKCGEEKPECRNCSTRALKCHYYSAFLSDRAQALQIQTGPRSSRFSCAKDALAFQYYIEVTNLWLEVENDPCCYSKVNQAFFNPFIINLMDSEPPIKHLILATSAAHRHLMEQTFENFEDLDRNDFFTSHYNAALHHVSENIERHGRRKLCIVLSSCVMFMVCDNFSRRTHRSREHFLAGLKILQDYERDTRPGAVDPKGRKRRVAMAGAEEIEYENMVLEYLKPLFDFYVSVAKHFGRQTRFTVRDRTLALTARRKMKETTRRDLPTLPCMHGKDGPPPINWEAYLAAHE